MTRNVFRLSPAFAIKQSVAMLLILFSVAAHSSAKPQSALQPTLPPMADIPGGVFMMGDTHNTGDGMAKPVRQVSIQPFKLGKFEVTYAEYDIYADATGRPRPTIVKAFDVGRGNNPVSRVTWQEAVDYAQWLSLQTGKKYRLPTEAEWQYAARAGTTSDFYWGDAPATDHSNTGLTWAKPSTGGKDKWLHSAPVGQFPANPFGLHDMHGNLWEWVQDCFNPNFNGAPTDGSAWQSGDCSRHVQLGNSFHNGPTPVYERGASQKANPTVGFRLAQDL